MPTISAVVCVDDSSHGVDAVLPGEARSRCHASVGALGQRDRQVSRAESLAARRDQNVLGGREIVAGCAHAAAGRDGGVLGQPAREQEHVAAGHEASEWTGRRPQLRTSDPSRLHIS